MEPISLTPDNLSDASRDGLRDYIEVVCREMPCAFDLVDVDRGARPIDSFIEIVEECSPITRHALADALGDVMSAYAEGLQSQPPEVTGAVLNLLAMAEILRSLEAVADHNSVMDAVILFAESAREEIASAARRVLSTWGSAQALSILTSLYREAARPSPHIPALLRARAHCAPMRALELDIDPADLQAIAKEPSFLIALEGTITRMFEVDAQRAGDIIVKTIIGWPTSVREFVIETLASEPLDANPHSVECADLLRTEVNSLVEVESPALPIIYFEHVDAPLLRQIEVELTNPSIPDRAIGLRGQQIAQDAFVMEKMSEFSNGGHGKYPVLPQQALRLIHASQHGEFSNAERLGELELALVRQSVKLDIEEEKQTETFQASNILLDEVEKRIPNLPSLEDNAKGRLAALGFNERPFYLGESEYHQDRLLMRLAEAGLKRRGLLGAEVRLRPWDSNGFNLWNDNRDQANVVMRGSWVPDTTPDGIYRFSGFRIFIRLDVLQRHLHSAPGETIALDAEKLLQAIGGGGGARDALDVKSRASLVLHLGLLHARGSAFEDLKKAIENLAERRPSKTQSKERMNDEAFANFIKGKSAIYCGGAINGLLIDTWWTRAAPDNFLEILNHEELAQGFQAGSRRSRASVAPLFVENRLHFHGLGSNAKEAKAAQKAVIQLFRGIGRGLQNWSNAVVARPDRLNGLKRPCQAARRLLEPRNELGAGHYAFVTSLTDPAALISETDTFYLDNGKLPN